MTELELANKKAQIWRRVAFHSTIFAIMWSPEDRRWIGETIRDYCIKADKEIQELENVR